METKTKMTAVEWLEEQTRKSEWHSLKRQDIFQQAKEIEKERMKDAWDDGLFGKTDNFQQYYNETFGK